MENKIDEARDLVRSIIDEGLVDENIGKTITKDGEEIQITKPDEKSVRFDLPRMKKSYVLMSGRLYERDFILNLSETESDQDEPEDDKPPELSVVDTESLPVPELDFKEESEEIETHSGSDMDEALLETGEPEIEPPMVQQLDYKGKPEEVNPKLFKNKIECECGNDRWVKNADLFQVKKCKPCTYRDRLNRRKQKRTRK